jgi:bifunctional DNA-binding transcriptional regulator/antitoxin component of YhaV-PrlF toxin-antitoxin module
MPKAERAIRFETVLVKHSNESGWHFLNIDKSIAERLGFTGKSRRVVCTINDFHTFQCALLPMSGDFCIVVNKTIRETLGIADGHTVRVKLERDESKYGLPMPEELREVLNQDPEGDRLFHALTKGKQRTMLYYIGKWKDVDRRIHYALVFIEHLKKNLGKINWKQLGEELKRRMP